MASASSIFFRSSEFPFNSCRAVQGTALTASTTASSSPERPSSPFFFAVPRRSGADSI
jgi:hypothetical protein